MKQTIVLKNGQSLSAGDTFYYVNPELRDGTITKCTVDSFWPADAGEYYGFKIRHTVPNKSMWLFVYQQFFERENPTCFINYDDAKKQADKQRYS